MGVYALGEHRPLADSAAFIADNAAVVGRVELGRDSSVWWSATVRGDTEPLYIGAQSNIQDGAVVHADPGCPAILGQGVTVGHRAVVHGCTVKDYSLVGIAATVLNRAVVGPYALVAANALVPEDMEVPEGTLVMGAPARVKRSLTEEEKARLRSAAERYVVNARRYAESLVRIRKGD